MESLLLLIILWAVLSEAHSLSSLEKVMGRKGGSVWIPCYYDVKYNKSVKLFFYKGVFGRHIILAQTEPILKTGAGDRITISDDKSQGMFTITMRRLEKRDEHYYYCGLKMETQTEEFYLYLHVDAGDYGLSINSNSNVFTGQEKGSVAVSCKYTYPKYVSFIKYWCRGRDFDSCQKLKVSDSPRNDNNRVSIRDDTARQEFTVTMTSLQMTDSDWYWCAIQKAYWHERVPVYIRVTPAPETDQLQIDTLSSLPSTVTSVMTVTTSRNQRVKNITISGNSTDYRSERPGTHSVSEANRAHLTIVLVIGGLLLLFLTAGIFTLRMKRNRKGETQNEKRTMQAEEGRTEVQADEEVQYADVTFRKNTKRNLNVTELHSEDVQYTVISFQRKSTKDTKPSRDPEDSGTYAVIGIKGTADMYIFEN